MKDDPACIVEIARHVLDDEVMTEPFRCVVADPPWAPRDKLPGKSRGAAKQYPVMSTDEIISLTAGFEAPYVRRIMGQQVDENAVLFLWRLASMQDDALRVAAMWGFRVVSEIVWQKLTVNGKPHFGMGRTVRGSHETALICVRGRSSRVITSHRVRSVFAAPVPSINGRPIHSAKPDEFFAIVEDLCAGPRLELFARKRRDGWTQIGNQLGERS